MKDYYTVKEYSQKEIVVKKSKFIAHCFPVESEGEAEVKIGEIKRLHYKAAHNTYAYILGYDGATFKYSDDGEPSLTAGKPIYDCIKGRKLTNILIVVTRYFGGIKLGTGGLVRAYGDSAQEVLNSVEIVKMQYNTCFEINTDYTYLGTIQNYCNGYDTTVEDSLYGENVVLKICIPEREEDRFEKGFVEVTNAKADIKKTEEKYIRK